MPQATEKERVRKTRIDIFGKYDLKDPRDRQRATNEIRRRSGHIKDVNLPYEGSVQDQDAKFKERSERMVRARDYYEDKDKSPTMEALRKNRRRLQGLKPEPKK